MKILIDRNTAVRAVCELMRLPYETRETVHGRLEYLPVNDSLSFDFSDGVPEKDV